MIREKESFYPGTLKFHESCINDINTKKELAVYLRQVTEKDVPTDDLTRAKALENIKEYLDALREDQ